MTTNPAIRIDSVTKTFGDLTAVDNVSLDIPAGQIVALLGPNGAGKTTLLDMVLGFTRPDAGTIRLHTAEHGQLTPTQATRTGAIAATLQTKGLLGDLRVGETLRMVHGLMPRPLPLDQVIDQADVADFLDRKVSKASGGQIQRLRFALAIMSDPQILLLDEPTSGMDNTVRREFWKTMKAWTETGRTVIFATHYLPEAEDFAERIVLMARGRIASDTPTRELLIGQRKTITATWLQPAQDPFLVLPALQPGLAVADIGFDPDTGQLTVASTASDALVLQLLSRKLAANITVTQHALEDIFDELSALSEAGTAAQNTK